MYLQITYNRSGPRIHPIQIKESYGTRCGEDEEVHEVPGTVEGCWHMDRRSPDYQLTRYTFTFTLGERKKRSSDIIRTIRNHQKSSEILENPEIIRNHQKYYHNFITTFIYTYIHIIPLT